MRPVAERLVARLAAPAEGPAIPLLVGEAIGRDHLDTASDRQRTRHPFGRVLTTPIDGSYSSSNGTFVSLSQATRRPDGHSFPSRIAKAVEASSGWSTRFQICPPKSQNRANEQRFSASVRIRFGPACSSACWR